MARKAERSGKPRKGQQGVARSFNHAYQGLIFAVRTQRNMRVHAIIAVLVLAGSLLVSVSALELAALVLTIMVVFAAELFNTAMEFAVDLVTKEYHPLAKLAKDALESTSRASGILRRFLVASLSQQCWPEYRRDEV